MNFLLLIVTSLASFRFTRLITDDKITDWLRRDVAKAGKKAKEGISCPFCVSGWVSLCIVIALSIGGLIEFGFSWIWWGAIWGASVLWNQIFVRLSK